MRRNLSACVPPRASWSRSRRSSAASRRTGAECAIVKDGGDDIDATTGLPVVAAVTLLPDAPRTVTIDGGAGVGRVTKPGLDQPVGAAAINHVPRQMITEALLKEADAVGYGGGFAVTVSIEGGEQAAAKRTFNPHIGVEGGLSVLGTSGIVEPMSQQALLDTLQLEIHQAALKSRRLILAPGNYGLDYLAAQLRRSWPEFPSSKSQILSVKRWTWRQPNTLRKCCSSVMWASWSSWRAAS